MRRGQRGKATGVRARRMHQGTRKGASAGSLHLAGERVELNEWAPEHETLARKLVQPERILSEFESDVFLPLHHRALIAAGLLNE